MKQENQQSLHPINKGEEVLLRHTVEYDKKGNPFVCGASKHAKSNVVATYMTGDKVKVTSGDVWKVIRLSHGLLATVIK